MTDYQPRHDLDTTLLVDLAIWTRYLIVRRVELLHWADDNLPGRHQYDRVLTLHGAGEVAACRRARRRIESIVRSRA